MGVYSIMSTVLYAGQQILSFPHNRSSHSFWKLIYCTEGSGKIRFNRSEVVKYQKNCLIIIPPNRRHVNQSSEDFRGMVIDLDGLPLEIESPLVLEDESLGHMAEICRTICYYYNAEDECGRKLLRRYADTLVDAVEMMLERQKISPVVRQIENCIITNFHDCSYELDEYLRSFPFSYDYLRKLFKKEMGVTPHRYLNDLRLNTAAKLLTEGYVGNANVAEVSRRCGFQEPLYFSRMFKKKFGLAPSYYEDRNKSDEN